MEDKLNNIKREYKNIIIPKELDHMVDKTIQKADKDVRKIKIRFGRGLKVAVAALAVCSMFVLAINTNESLAKSIANVPVLGKVAEVLTFVDYERETETITEDVTIPEVDGLNDKEIQDKINKEIQAKMDEQIKEAEIRAEEYKEAYFATGGTKENYHPIEFKLDYEKKYSDDSILSFIIYHHETLAPAYAETYYYNIDLNTNEELTLEDVLGEDYINRANESVRKQIEELKTNPSEDRHYGFFEGEAGFTSISEDQGFYINSDKKVVVVFNKYEIADGATGPLEFVIE